MKALKALQISTVAPGLLGFGINGKDIDGLVGIEGSQSTSSQKFVVVSICHEIPHAKDPRLTTKDGGEAIVINAHVSSA